MTVKSNAAWAESVHAAVGRLPVDLRWRVQVGCLQTLRPTVCRHCGKTEFRIASPTTVTCVACSTLSSADTDGRPLPGYVDLGYERHRVRVVVRSLNCNQQRSVTATRWRSELAAGLWGPPQLIREGVSKTFPRLLELERTLDPDDFATRLARLTALTNIRHGRAIVYATGGGWSPATRTHELEEKVAEALLHALGCQRGERWIWYRPDDTVVFAKDRELAGCLAAFEGRERYASQTDRGILPVHLTPTRPAWQVRRWENMRMAARTIFPDLVDTLRRECPGRTLADVHAVAAALLRNRDSDLAGKLRELSSEIAASLLRARSERRQARAFRRALSERGTRDMAYATYALPFVDRVGNLRKLKTYLESEGYRVERMFDYLLDPETENRAEPITPGYGLPSPARAAQTW